MPVTSRSFAALQAIYYEMQQNPLRVYGAQGGEPSATRADGKVLDFKKDFGFLRVHGNAIDENWMGGSTIGYALSGAPAAIQFPSMTPYFPIEHIATQASLWTHISGGTISVQLVLWFQGASRTVGAGQQHGYAGQESLYAAIPGLKVVVPHKVYDVKGLMAAALRDGNPVALFDYTTEASADIPDEPYTVPIGKSAILQEGTDITIATWPPASTQVEAALKTLATAGVKAEYLDVRTLKPLDEATLATSVTKTKRLLVVSHGHYTNDSSSHVIAMACQAVSGLKVRKITFPDAPPPQSGVMLGWMLPDAAKIADAAKKLIG